MSATGRDFVFYTMPELHRKAVRSCINNRNLKPNKLYPQLCYIAYWLNGIAPNNTFINDLKALLIKYPNVPLAAMGFPLDWLEEPLWK